jgi:hypothetical protein
MKNAISKMILGVLMAFIITMIIGVDAQGAKLALKEYSDTVILQKDGVGVVRTKVICAGGCPAALRLPFTYANPQNLKAVQGDPKGENKQLSVQVIEENSISFLQVSGISSLSPDLPIVVSFEVPKYFDWKKARHKGSGLYTWKHEFDNTIPAKIDKYEVDLVLPEGYTLQAVERSRPALTSKDPKAPYRFFIDDQKHHVSLSADKGLKMGKEASLEVTFKDEKKSLFFLIIFALFGAGYLFFYRDLLKRAKELRASEKKA